MMFLLQMNWMLWFSIYASFCRRYFTIVPNSSFGCRLPTILREILSEPAQIIRITKKTLLESFDISWKCLKSSILLLFSLWAIALNKPSQFFLPLFLNGQLMRQSGFLINKSVVMAAVMETAFKVVFPVQQTAFAPNLATSVVVLTPNMATSDSAEAATNAPPRTAVGVTTLRSRIDIVRTSSLSTKGGRKGAMMSINASRAIVPYLMI